jgi:FtsH-binding integral membrane protein
MNQQDNLFGYISQREQATVAKTFMAGVFGWMTIAMAITAFTAYMFASDMGLMGLLVRPEGGMSMLGWIVMLAPFGFVMLMSMGYQRLSAMVLGLLFGVFSVLMGMSLSFIFLAYTMASIAKTFVITSGMFGVMAIVGYTTKTDLTKFGSIMFMALIGLIIASLVNMFMQSSAMEYIISFAGVIIFTGLTAYDVQKLKKIGSETGAGGEAVKKVTILGALTLYLDFINLFLFLLRFFGNRK